MALAGVCMADTIRVAWDAVAGAAGYRLYRSNDLGASWEQVKEISEPGEITAVVTVDGDKLVLIRAAAGVCYHGGWRAPEKPRSFGIE